MDHSKTTYRRLLEDGYRETCRDGTGTIYAAGQRGRLEFLSELIFCFDTHDSELSVLFAQRAVEVCEAINDGKTFDYIADRNGDQTNYRWYLVMCNMPFFATRISWGTSIRGAFWDPHGCVEYRSFGLWLGDEQMFEPIWFTLEQWQKFISAVIEFSRDV